MVDGELRVGSVNALVRGNHVVTPKKQEPPRSAGALCAKLGLLISFAQTAPGQPDRRHKIVIRKEITGCRLHLRTIKTWGRFQSQGVAASSNLGARFCRNAVKASRASAEVSRSRKTSSSAAI